ncbi:CLUMA_CG003023, isoform A [Clunio marinus]|uniref:CLUMA_CG003023, isoform A n=1 Tax=Clunio marinus TaxID=568069 RepID=A0A1J1HMH0_9DIPT|nr:CLUMA_CG003023, isoform A [Clunio marinus]
MKLSDWSWIISKVLIYISWQMIRMIIFVDDCLCFCRVPTNEASEITSAFQEKWSFSKNLLTFSWNLSSASMHQWCFCRPILFDEQPHDKQLIFKLNS